MGSPVCKCAHVGGLVLGVGDIWYMVKYFGFCIERVCSLWIVLLFAFLFRKVLLLDQVALAYPEPLSHFALVCGTRSGPALRCYSPGSIDKELVEAAENFLRNGGIVIDADAKVASVSKILSW